VQFALVAIIAFFFGKAHQHLKTGYSLEVFQEKKYKFQGHDISLKQVGETVGFAFLDTGKSIIEDHTGLVRLFQTQRYFQESYPYVEKLIISGNTISWNDRVDEYQLTINRMPKNVN
jgi:hypothetical protein